MKLYYIRLIQPAKYNEKFKTMFPSRESYFKMEKVSLTNKKEVMPFFEKLEH